jgi:tetratricopeptide (TPR) repeat protein
VDEEDRDILGVACVLRCSVPRSELPETAKPVIPVDVNGMVVLSDTVKNNITSVADEELMRKWHSAAADHWLDKDDTQERLYHLVCSGRIKDACKLVANDHEKLTNNINDDLFDILAGMDVPDRYLTGVLPVKITVALESGDTDRAEALVTALMAKDNEIGLLYSADIEMKNGNHAKALEIVKSLKDSDRFEVKLRRAEALGHLGDEKGAFRILEDMKHNTVSSGTVDGIDRIYIQMSAISAASGKYDSSVGYLLKALNVTTDDGKKRIYGLLATSYDALGADDKAKDCRVRSR